MLFSYDLFATKESEDMANWGSNGEYTHLLLKDRTDIDGFNRKIKHFTQEKIKSIYRNDQLKYLLPWEGEIFAQRYSERYLHNHYENGVPTGGRTEYVKLFSIIAIFVLIIACINFMNLSTAKASRRIKEVGIRKLVVAEC
jgi:putative ABC transport system permease protein